LKPTIINKKPGLLARLMDHLFFLRPLLILPIWAPLFLGYWASGGRGLDIEYLILLFLGIFLGGAIYGLNQIYDIEGDKINDKNLSLSLNLISPKAAWVISIISAILSIGLAALINIWLVLMVILGLLFGVLYSHPKFKLKDKPWGGMIINGLGHGALIYLMGWISASPLKWGSLLRALPYAIAFAGVYLATTIPDFKGDSITGKKTLAVSVGPSKAALLAVILICIASITGGFLREPALLLTGLFSFPFYIYATIKNHDKFNLANKIAVLMLNIWICFYLFHYIVPLAIVVVGSRFYYKLRLGLKYP